MGQAKARRNKFGNLDVHSPMEYFTADILVAVSDAADARQAQSAIAEATLIASLPSAFHPGRPYDGAKTFLKVKDAPAPEPQGTGGMVSIDASGRYGRFLSPSEMREFRRVPGYGFTYYRPTSEGDHVAISDGRFVSATSGPIDDIFAFSVGKVRKSGSLVSIADRPFTDQLIGAIETGLRENDMANTIAHAWASAKLAELTVGANRWANADLDFLLSFMEQGPSIFSIDPDKIGGRNAAFATVVSLGDHLLKTPFIEAYVSSLNVPLRVWRPRLTDDRSIWPDFDADAATLTAATGHEFDIPELAARTSVEYAAGTVLAPEKIRQLESFLATGKVVAHLTGAAGTIELFDFGEDLLLVLTSDELKEMVTWSKSAPLGRTVKIPERYTEEIAAGMEDQAVAFREKFGRDMRPDDPLIFDPDADTPQPMSAEKITRVMVDTMLTSGFPRQFIYAYEKTEGMLVTEANRDQWSDADLKSYEAAIEEYFELVKQGKDPYAPQ